MDAVVIGGGVIGLSVAWRAARAGLSVAVVDPDPGSGASHFAAGMIAPVGEAEFGEEAVVALNRDSAARYPSFIAELELDAGRSAGYRQTRNAARRRRRRRADGARARSSGTASSSASPWSGSPRARPASSSPGLHRRSAAACSWNPTTRSILAPWSPTLLQACSRLGVQIHRSRASLLVERGRVAGVALEGGERIDASQVVLAAGCWSGAVPGVPRGGHPAGTAREGTDPAPARRARDDRADDTRRLRLHPAEGGRPRGDRRHRRGARIRHLGDRRRGVRAAPRGPSAGARRRRARAGRGVGRAAPRLAGQHADGR